MAESFPARYHLDRTRQRYTRLERFPLLRAGSRATARAPSFSLESSVSSPDGLVTPRTVSDACARRSQLLILPSRCQDATPPGEEDVARRTLRSSYAVDLLDVFELLHSYQLPR